MVNFTPGIPDPSGNPFVSVSTLPEGTLFIVVGAILLGIIVTVLLWRTYVIWAAHRAAVNNEARFTALEPSYGGPFVDPVEKRRSMLQDDSETSMDKSIPESHPIGVPLNPRRYMKNRPRPKSQVDRMREAHASGKFFSPTADVLLNGYALPPNLLGGTANPSTAGGRQSTLDFTTFGNGSRLSVLHSGRNSGMHQASMSSSDLGSFDPRFSRSSMQGPLHGALPVPMTVPMGPPTGSVPPSGTHTRNTSMAHSVVPDGGANPPRTKKLRPPSTYLDDLVG